jgi:hypothetical protein
MYPSKISVANLGTDFQAVTTWVCGTNVLRNTGSQEQGILRMTGLRIEGSGDHWFFRMKDLRTHRQDRPLGEYYVSAVISVRTDQ